MKNYVLLCVGIILAAATAGAQEPRRLPQAATVTLPAKPAPVQNLYSPANVYTSPAGWHRHLTADGRVIEHHDANNHRGAITVEAHRGLAQSLDGTWPKYSGPRAPDRRILGIGRCPT